MTQKLVDRLCSIIAEAVGHDRGTEEIVRDVLSAIEREGWKVVPVEPTLKMLEDGCDANNFQMEDIPHVWAAMLSTAPRIA